MSAGQPVPKLVQIVTSKWFLGAVGLTALLLSGVAYCFDQSLRDLGKSNNYSELEALSMLSNPSLQSRLIRTGNSDYRFNCHGWTFTHGQREVEAEEVEERLAEGYQPTLEPQLGDIIIYRDHVGQVMHSGIVKAVGEDGFVLIESKWGVSGRFIHEPDISRTFASHQYFHRIPDLAKTKPVRERGEDGSATIEATSTDN